MSQEPWEVELPTLLTRLPRDDRRTLWRDLKVKVDGERIIFLQRWEAWLDWSQLYLPFGRCMGQNLGLLLNARPQPWQPPYHDFCANHRFETVLAGLRELDRQEYERRWEEINRQKGMQSWRRKKRQLVTKRELDNPERVEAALPIRKAVG